LNPHFSSKSNPEMFIFVQFLSGFVFIDVKKTLVVFIR
jgi:hypothetical protein